MFGRYSAGVALFAGVVGSVGSSGVEFNTSGPLPPHPHAHLSGREEHKTAPYTTN